MHTLSIREKKNGCCDKKIFFKKEPHDNFLSFFHYQKCHFRMLPTLLIGTVIIQCLLAYGSEEGQANEAWLAQPRPPVVWVPPAWAVTLFVAALGLLFGLITALVMFVWPEQRPGRPNTRSRAPTSPHRHTKGSSCPCC